MFFFDEILGLHINDSPLLVSSKVVNSARKIGLCIRWNSDGYICGISHDACAALSQEPGIKMLSACDFMALNKRQPRMASSEFPEWLTDLYTITTDGQYLDSCGGTTQMPLGRPGWFDLEDIDDAGLSMKLSSLNSKGKWKYWSLEDPTFTSGAMRSFFTSSGTRSLDLGIPKFATHRMLMIRECYRTKELIKPSKIYSIWDTYQGLTNSRDD